MRNLYVFIMFFCCCIPGIAMAHGNLATGSARANVSIPNTLWDYLISSADGALTMTIKEVEGNRYLKTNGVADHATGQFPGRGNPHRIIPRDVTYRVPLKPTKSPRTRQVGHADFGIAINGIPFDAATAEFWGGRRGGEWNYEAINGGLDLGLDQNNAHVQPDGTYHYHGLPEGLLDQHPYRARPVLIGYAADGFPIYPPYGYSNADDPDSGLRELRPSYRVKSGIRPGGPGGKYDGRFTRDWEYVEGRGDLDACNGRRGVTPEFPEETYYYVITSEFPFIPRCWVGEADNSFQKSPGNARGMGGSRSGGGFSRGRPRPVEGPPPGGGQRRPPEGAMNACRDKSESARCQFEARFGPIVGQCRTVRGGDMACVPEHHRR